MKACLGLEALLPQRLARMAGKLALAAGRRPQFLPRWTFLWGCLRAVTSGSWILPNEQGERDRSPNFF